MAKSPKTLYEPSTVKEAKAKYDPSSYLATPISWQLGNIDLDSRWHAHIMLSRFEFNLNEDIEDWLLKYYDVNRPDAEKIERCLREIDRKNFNTIHEFIADVNNKSKCNIPNELVYSLTKCIETFYFWKSIYPKMKTLESMTWDEFSKATHGKQGKSNSHFVSVNGICKEAQRRLHEMKLDDLEELYSMRLEGKVRIFGIRQYGYIKILWIDEEHEVWEM